MDFSKLSTPTLKAMKSGEMPDFSKLSTEELQEIKKGLSEQGQQQAAPPPEDQALPGPLQQQDPGTLHDFGKGMVHGAAFGGDDEVGGGLQSLLDMAQSAGHNIAPSLVGASPTQSNEALEKQGFKNAGPSSEAQFYRKAQEEDDADNKAAGNRSPWAYNGGQLTGGALSAILTSGMAPELMSAGEGAGILAKTAAHAVNAAPIGALYGSLESGGHIIGANNTDEALKVLKDTGTGALTGSVVGAGLSLAGQGLGALAKTDAARKIAGYYGLGKEGIDLGDKATQLGTLANPETLENPLSMHDQKFAGQMLDGINHWDDQLGQEVGETVAQATQNGTRIKAKPDLVQRIDQLFKNLPENLIGDQGVEETLSGEYGNDQFKKMYDMARQLQSPEGISPVQLQQFRNELAATTRKLPYDQQYIISEAYKVVSDLTKELRQSVPGYELAANRLNEFRQSIPETILSKDVPSDIANLRMSGTRNVDKKLTDNIVNIVKGLYTGNAKAQASYTNLLKGINTLNQSEMARKASGKIGQTLFEGSGIQPQDVENMFKQGAWRSKLLQEYNPTPGVTLGKNGFGVSGGSDFVANKAGQAAKSVGQSPMVDISQKLYNASDESLKSMTPNLRQVPGGSSIADALDKAIANKNSVGKNAILFSILQNPALRSLVDSDSLPLEP